MEKCMEMQKASHGGRVVFAPPLCRKKQKRNKERWRHLMKYKQNYQSLPFLYLQLLLL